ncbi:MAG: hypothetical protein QW165_04695 [Candidatus Woesearchaeota archaeon]
MSDIGTTVRILKERSSELRCNIAQALLEQKHARVAKLCNTYVGLLNTIDKLQIADNTVANYGKTLEERTYEEPFSKVG